MLWKDLLLMKFKNGFRILNNNDAENKFFVIDDIELEVGDVYRVGPNGYFEHIGNTADDLSAAVTRANEALNALD